MAVKFSNAVTLVKADLKARRPFILWGQPGIGKSDLVRQVAAEQKLRVLDIRAAQLDPVDVRGIPVADLTKNVTRWLTSALWPVDGIATLVFFDELAQACVAVQNALLQVLLDRKCGDWVAPDNCFFGAASNRVEDRAGAGRLTTACSMRLHHIDLSVDQTEWNTWAIGANVRADVRSFLQFCPSALCEFLNTERTSPNPRGWAFVSDTIGDVPKDLELEHCSGYIGAGRAAEYVAHKNLKLPDLDELLKDPAGAKVYDESEGSIAYALCGALTERLRKDVKVADGFVAYVNRLPKIFTVLAMRDGAAAQAKLRQNDGYKAFVKANATLLTEHC